MTVTSSQSVNLPEWDGSLDRVQEIGEALLSYIPAEVLSDHDASWALAFQAMCNLGDWYHARECAEAEQIIKSMLIQMAKSMKLSV